MWEVVVILGVGLVMWLYSIRPRRIPGVPEAPNSVPFLGHMFVVRHFGTKQFLDETVEAALLHPKQHYTFSFPDKPIILRLCTWESVQYLLKDGFEKYIKMDGPRTKML